MTTSQITGNSARLSLRHYGIILFTLATAILHLSLFPELGYKPDPIVLNGLGYLGLLGAYFVSLKWFQQRHRLIWWVLFGYTLLTIILWIILGDKQFVLGTYSATGYYAKAAEVILLIFLWLDKPKT
jgi:hypothetical protein